MSRLAIITARGGSKRIPKKNIKDFCGKPIIAYSIEAAMESGLFDEVMVSTDSTEIAETAEKYGAVIPFMRSEKTADDYATTADVILEVIEKYRELGKTFDYICCIYPTAPFVTAEKLIEGMKLMETKHPVLVMPVAAFSYPPQRCYVVDENGNIQFKYKEYMNSRSQDLEKQYHDAGQFYIYDAKKYISAGGRISEGIMPIFVSELQVQDIDNEDDWNIAELKFRLMHQKKTCGKADDSECIGDAPALLESAAVGYPNGIPYGKQSVDEADIRAVTDVLRSDYLTTGPNIQEFEQAVCHYTGAKYATAISNGTAALHAACFAAGIGAGDEVITTPLTFAASANCVIYCGGTPVFADVDPKTYNLNPEDVRRKITKKTKAIIAVHLAGQPCDMDALHVIAKEHHLIVIEDGAHALGSVYKGKKVGALSDMTTFSFHPVKPITTGEGGMIVTDNPGLYKRLCLFRSHGITRDLALMTRNEGPWFYQQLDLGYNYRITDMQCALGISQMKKLEYFIGRRRELAKRYNEAFADCPNIVTPYQLPETNSGWHLYIIQVKNYDRKEIFEKLRAAGIGVNVHYIPVYFHPYYQKHGYRNVHCPNAEEIYSRMISLPLYPGLTNEAQDFIIAKVKEFIHETV